jgi:hypothetical protein
MKYDHDSVFLVAFIGCKATYHFVACREYLLRLSDLLVGSGSFAFHSTLKCMLLDVPIHLGHWVADSETQTRCNSSMS